MPFARCRQKFRWHPFCLVSRNARQTAQIDRIKLKSSNVEELRNAAQEASNSTRAIEWFYGLQPARYSPELLPVGLSSAQLAPGRMSTLGHKTIAGSGSSDLEILVDLPGLESVFTPVHVDALTPEPNSLEFESCSLLPCS